MENGNHRREIFVYADWVEISEPVLMGTLYSEKIRGKEIFSQVGAPSYAETGGCCGKSGRPA